MRFYDGIDALVYVAVMGAHVGFAPRRVAAQYQLVMPDPIELIKLLAYDPLVDASTTPLCVDHRPATMLIQWFLARHRAPTASVPAYAFVTRTLGANATRASARGCPADEGIGPELTLALLGRPRGGGRLPRAPRIPWRVDRVDPTRLPPAARRAMHNASYRAKNKILPQN